ncbi:hypothetical protein [Xanthomonas bonasiae]|uniref:hypothetical protein n=1 Tax=Xanthomonas bonasiae TaxID=2810351 RepID=UPI00197F4183|nr:hypothetical protein [Xanthomonas bonasiae]MBN6114032.1 hypothetical protein [Xanthomonas bonasiae]
MLAPSWDTRAQSLSAVAEACRDPLRTAREQPITPRPPGTPLAPARRDDSIDALQRVALAAGRLRSRCAADPERSGFHSRP